MTKRPLSKPRCIRRRQSFHAFQLGVHCSVVVHEQTASRMTTKWLKARETHFVKDRHYLVRRGRADNYELEFRRSVQNGEWQRSCIWGLTDLRGMSGCVQRNCRTPHIHPRISVWPPNVHFDRDLSEGLTILGAWVMEWGQTKRTTVTKPSGDRDG